MKPSLNVAGFLCASVILLLGGCDRVARSMYLSGCHRDIRSATKAIEAARDDMQRAAGYAARGRGYGEKARYSLAFKLIPVGEYDRLFNLAMADHDRGVALALGNTDVYFKRGETLYWRGVVEDPKAAGRWFDRAAADFKKAAETDGKNHRAYDMLGLIHMATNQLDAAIDDFTKEAALAPYGRARLADAYCARGSVNHRAKKYDAAIADYEKSVEIGATADGCSCEPYNPLITLYTEEGRRFDKAWDVVHKAKKAKKWLGPDVLEKLKKDSGRND